MFCTVSNAHCSMVCNTESWDQSAFLSERNWLRSIQMEYYATMKKCSSSFYEYSQEKVARIFCLETSQFIQYATISV